MEIREIQADFNLQYNSLPRSPGLHVSQIIRDVASTMGYLKQDDQDDLDWTLAKYRLTHGEHIAQMHPTAMYRVAMGLAWEDWLGPQHDINYHSLGELERDGIVGTPDGLSFDPDTGAGTLHEIKLTWRSSKSDRITPQELISHQFMWLSQTKAYCWQACGAGVEVYRAHLHVYFVNGNYRGSGPEYRRYQIDFTEQELVSNWRLITNAAKALKL